MVGDGCLENGCVIVQDVEAEWSRSEEGESLDQSLSLKQHPTSLEKLLVQPFSLSLRWHLLFTCPILVIPTDHQEHINHLEKKDISNLKIFVWRTQHDTAPAALPQC